MADAGGGFATTTSAANRIQSKIDLALSPQWGNTRMYEAVIRVPEGQTLNIGRAAPQTIDQTGTILRGQGDQMLMPRDWPLEWIQEIRVVPSR